MSIKYMVDMKRFCDTFDQHDSKDNYHGIVVKIGGLHLKFHLTDADRLRLIEFLAGARDSESVELHSIDSAVLKVPTKRIELTPEVLHVRQVDMSRFEKAKVMAVVGITEGVE